MEPFLVRVKYWAPPERSAWPFGYLVQIFLVCLN